MLWTRQFEVTRAEAAVLAALVGRGYRVLVPFGGGHPYDLAIDLAATFLRVQCKTGWECRGSILFNCRSTDHGNGAQPYTGRADIFGVYFSPTGAVYLVPIWAVAEHEGRLRLLPARNNQRRRTRPAADFEIDRWSSASLATLAAAA
jgi:hypothetical protein